MRESDLADVWEETLRRMRACFEFAEPEKAAKPAQDAKRRAAPARPYDRKDEITAPASPSR